MAWDGLSPSRRFICAQCEMAGAGKRGGTWGEVLVHLSGGTRYRPQVPALVRWWTGSDHRPRATPNPLQMTPGRTPDKARLRRIHRGDHSGQRGCVLEMPL